jgi:predicted nucleotide-binding protein
MQPYQLTPEEQRVVRELEDFRNAVKRWARADRAEERERLRSLINRRLEGIQEIVRLAGYHQTLTISPPPMIGGLVMRNLDPFNYIFQDVYGESLHGPLFDMLDKAIGVIESGKFEERKSHLKKAGGPLGPISGRKVFLVHGHDEAARETTARFIEKLSLEPIILHEQPNAGQTIIEKVERCSEVAFAVVLLTPDDVGARRGSENELVPRARQNVILELGYFLARLGRKHVAALVKGELERPSDYDGVVYVPMEDAGAWKILLARELKAAGLNVDLNDAV